MKKEACIPKYKNNSSVPHLDLLIIIDIITQHSLQPQLDGVSKRCGKMMTHIVGKACRLIIRRTLEDDIEFVITAEREEDNAQYAGQ